MAKILLVEDNQLNLDMLSRRLRRAGFDVIVATDGETGVAMVARERPDVVLMDLSLPILDGWAATRRIKSDPELAATPVIALTAHAMIDDPAKARAAGCDDFDTKPVDMNRLLAKMRALLEARGHG